MYFRIFKIKSMDFFLPNFCNGYFITKNQHYGGSFLSLRSMANCSSRRSEKHAGGFRRTPLIADSSLRRGISSVIWLYYNFHSIGILLSVLQCHACSVTWHTPTLAQPAENQQKHADAERDA